MELERIAELLSPFVPAPLELAELEAVQAYLSLLVRWNARTNLTAIRDEQHIVTRHFGESLFAASLLLDRNGTARVVDIGSGAGFPGLPLKIYAAGITLTLIESQNKKATFLREVTRDLRLRDVTVFQSRAEQYPGAADLVILRAVEHFREVLPVAASIAERTEITSQAGDPGVSGTGGKCMVSPEATLSIRSPRAQARLALLIGSGQVNEARRALPTFLWERPVPLPGSSSRVVLVGRPNAE